MTEFTIYHNPNCTKSRASLALLNDRALSPLVIEYLKTPPTAAELKSILGKLGIKPEQLVRRGEEIFQKKYAGKSLSDKQWIQAMVEDPILIERPIVVRGDRAVIGRPLDNLLALLG